MRTSPAKLSVLILIVLAVGSGIFFALRGKPQPPVAPVEAPKPLEPVRTVIGSSVEGRNIESFTYGTGAKKLAFVGGIHGGYEWNSVLLAYRLMDYLRQNLDAIPKDLTVIVIPDANPDAVFKATGKEGRFDVADVSTSTKVLEAARFNAHNVDLNRNFDCKWKSKSAWRSKTVNAGTKAFSEPEAAVIRDLALNEKPEAMIFWHSQSNAVYASQCADGILPETLSIMNAYSKASGYPAVKTFDAYATTGAADDWLASIRIPAITVELSTHQSIEFDRNLKGVKALFKRYGNASTPAGQIERTN